MHFINKFLFNSVFVNLLNEGVNLARLVLVRYFFKYHRTDLSVLFNTSLPVDFVKNAGSLIVFFVERKVIIVFAWAR